MEIYLEYAILENFLIDGALLYLSQAAARKPVCLWRLCLAAAIGAGFAVLFPLLALPPWLGYVLKFAVGALLCLVAQKPNKGKGLWLSVLLFYAFSFCLGGGLIALFEGFGLPYFTLSGGGVLSTLPVGGLLALSAVFVACVKWGIEKLYARKRQTAHIVSCRIERGQARLRVNGFVDTGNTAFYGGRAVCFTTPDIVYRLFGLSEPTAHMTVRTVSGERSIALYAVERICMGVGGEEKVWEKAYLSPAVHILGKEYSLLLPECESL